MATYIDLTDIFHFMRYAKNVTGIQRTTLLMVEALLNGRAVRDLRFIAYHPVFKRMVEFDGAWLREVRGRLPEDFVRQFSLYANGASLREMVELWFASPASPARRPRKWRKPNPVAGDVICVLGNYWGSLPLFRYLRKQSQRGVKIDVLIYDIIPLLFPEFAPASFNRLYRKRLLALNEFVSRYFAISQCTAEDLCSYLKQKSRGPLAPVFVIPLAQEFPFWQRGDDAARQLRPLVRDMASTPFVLCVGTIERRKNQLSLVKAWIRLQQELGDVLPQLVLLGKYGWYSTEIKALLDGGIGLGRIKQLSDASDSEVAYLFKQCQFTAYPSHYEGWGLPVGEALWFGKTCVTSTTSSMREAGGDMCLYVDPEDDSALYSALKELVLSPEKRVTLEKRIANNKLRTWHDVGVDMAGLLA